MVILLAMQVSNTEKKSEQTFCVLFKILASTVGKLNLVSKKHPKTDFHHLLVDDLQSPVCPIKLCIAKQLLHLADHFISGYNEFFC